MTATALVWFRLLREVDPVERVRDRFSEFYTSRGSPEGCAFWDDSGSPQPALWICCLAPTDTEISEVFTRFGPNETLTFPAPQHLKWLAGDRDALRF